MSNEKVVIRAALDDLWFKVQSIKEDNPECERIAFGETEVPLEELEEMFEKWDVGCK